MTKEQARKEYTEKRNGLNEGQIFQFNQQLYSHFFAHLDLSFAKVLHIYLSIESKHEPDTWTLLDRIRREYPHIRLAVPKVKADGTLEHFFYEGIHQLKINKWGIAEPQQGIPVDLAKIDIVIIPLLAFDRHGNRVGYGKGFYDQFLANCRPDCKKIGLSFFDEVASIEDVNDWDVALDQCITPKGIISF